MKMRRSHDVPLSDAAVACLPPRQASGFVFPSERGGHIKRNGVWKVMRRFKRVDPAQRKPITIHGFRATLSTWAEDHRIPAEGHKPHAGAQGKGQDERLLSAQRKNTGAPNLA